MSLGAVAVLIVLTVVGAYAAGVFNTVLPATCTIGQTGDAATVTISGTGARHACDLATKAPSVGGPAAWASTSPSTTQVLCAYKVRNLTVGVRWSQSSLSYSVCSGPLDPENWSQSTQAFTCTVGTCGAAAQPTPTPTPAPVNGICGLHYLDHDAIVTFDGPSAEDWCTALRRSDGYWFEFTPTRPAFLGVSYNTGYDGTTTVASVTAGSPADQAGIRQGDIITQVGNQPLDSNHVLLDVELQYRPGDTATFAISRGGQPVTVNVTFGAGVLGWAKGLDVVCSGSIGAGVQWIVLDSGGHLYGDQVCATLNQRAAQTGG